MEALRDYELLEFEKTFDFINYYVGSFYWLLKDNKQKPSIHDIRVDGQKLPNEIIKFTTDVFKDNLEQVNLRFNDVVKKEKLPSLIKYCFDNRIQPHQLRCRGFRDISVHEIEVKEVSYGN